MATVRESGDRVLTLTLYRPECLNAMNYEMRRDLARALRIAGERESVRAVVITGAGVRGFCAGQDLRESANLQAHDRPEWLASWSDLFRTLLEFPKPVIAAINGIAAGGGFEFAMCCDLRYAASHSDCLLSEIDVGLPTLTGSYLLRLHAFSSYSTELVLLGRRASASELNRLGVIHDVVLRGSALAHAEAAAERLADRSDATLNSAVRQIRKHLRDSFERDRVFEAVERYHSEGLSSGEHQQAAGRYIRV